MNDNVKVDSQKKPYSTSEFRTTISSIVGEKSRTQNTFILGNESHNSQPKENNNFNLRLIIELSAIFIAVLIVSAIIASAIVFSFGFGAATALFASGVASAACTVSASGTGAVAKFCGFFEKENFGKRIGLVPVDEEQPPIGFF